ncbi:9430_t:CDS:2, partial [Paraglomus occultum]
ELLLAAAKQDNDEILEEIFSQPGSYEINYTDSIGNTALHYAAQFGSLTAIRLLLEQENIKVNSQNRLEGDTPLHKAVQYTDDPSVAFAVVETLLDAGADPRILNKNKQRPVQLVDTGNEELKNLLRQAAASFEIDASELAQDDDSDDGEPASDVSSD